jgi:hypothetical protein
MIADELRRQADSFIEIVNMEEAFGRQASSDEIGHP